MAINLMTKTIIISKAYFYEKFYPKGLYRVCHNNSESQTMPAC